MISSQLLVTIAYHSYYSISAIQKQPPDVFYKKNVLKNFVKFTGKHMYWDLFFDKVACCSIIEKRLQHNCFTVKFEKFLRNLMYGTLANGCFWLHSFKFYISKAVLSLQQNKYVQSLTPSFLPWVRRWREHGWF